jgi:hypothetical protein
MEQIRVKSKRHFKGFIFFIFFTAFFLGIMIESQELVRGLDVLIGLISAVLWYPKAFEKIDIPNSN